MHKIEIRIPGTIFQDDKSRLEDLKATLFLEQLRKEEPAVRRFVAEFTVGQILKAARGNKRAIAWLQSDEGSMRLAAVAGLLPADLPLLR